MTTYVDIYSRIPLPQLLLLNVITVGQITYKCILGSICHQKVIACVEYLHTVLTWANSGEQVENDLSTVIHLFGGGFKCPHFLPGLYYPVSGSV